MSDGKTPVEAIKNTEIIIQDWIETALEKGEVIPPSKFGSPLKEWFYLSLFDNPNLGQFMHMEYLPSF